MRSLTACLALSFILFASPLPAQVGGDIPVMTYTGGDQLSPCIAMGGTGYYIVAWHGEGNGDDTGVYARMFEKDTTPSGGELNVNDDIAGAQSHPAAAFDDAGNHVIAWESYFEATGTTLILARKYKLTGEKDGDIFLVTENTGYDHFRPAIAMHQDGSFVITWYGGGDEDDLGVYACIFDDESRKTKKQYASFFNDKRMYPFRFCRNST